MESSPANASILDFGTQRDITVITPAASPTRQSLLLGDDAQSLIDCNQKLKELGIDETITLPQICVIGDQSTGKSSLIEAISSVQLPKAKGLCTQCPIAINIANASDSSVPWTCTVYIEKRYDYSQEKKSVTKNNPFGPWQERSVVDVINFDATNDKDKVSNIVRAAQTAVLDPDTDPAVYKKNPEARLSAKQIARFSPNVIRLDIAQLDWPNLSFIDLPGVIANAGKPQDKYLVDLIKNLVRKYASQQRSVNLLTLPMTHDSENSQACAIIQDLHVENRTLAVFTKPDLADGDQREQFLKKFSGIDDTLGFKHGYRIVMMSDQAVSEEESRRKEQVFFAETPWHDLDSSLKERLGVPALSSYLRRLLFEKTRETLPDNLRAIDVRLETVNTQLCSLPAPPNEIQLPLKLQQGVTNFEHLIKDLSHNAVARRAWNKNAVEFRNRLAANRPMLFLRSRAETKTFNRVTHQVTNQPPTENNEEFQEPYSSGAASSMSVPISTLNAIHQFRLEEVRELNEQHYSGHLPGEMDLGAIEALNKLSVQNWYKLLEDYMLKNRELLRKQVHRCFMKSFAGYEHLEIFHVTEDCVEKFLAEALNLEEDRARELCQRERDLPFTLDCKSLKQKEESCLEILRNDRVGCRSELVKAKIDAREGKVMKTRPEAKPENLSLDGWDIEIQMTAKVLAYYEIASSRFADNVAQSIFCNLLPRCSAPLVDHIQNELGIHDPTRHAQIVRWMTEDQEREVNRARLLQEQQQLTEGHRYIRDALGLQSPSKRAASPGFRTAYDVWTPSRSPKKQKSEFGPEEQLGSSQTMSSADHMETD